VLFLWAKEVRDSNAELFTRADKANFDIRVRQFEMEANKDNEAYKKNPGKYSLPANQEQAQRYLVYWLGVIMAHLEGVDIEEVCEGRNGSRRLAA